MKILKLELDLMNGPVWKGHYDISTDEMNTGIPVVDNDTIVQELNDLIQNAFNSCYDVSDDGGCVFDEQRWNGSIDDLRPVYTDLIARLEVINEGTFEIEDYLSEVFRGS